MTSSFFNSHRIRMTLVAIGSVLLVYFVKEGLGVSDAFSEHTMTVLVGIAGWYLANRTATHTQMFSVDPHDEDEVEQK